jgi:polysaccharide biosynthesis/export protein
MVVEVLLKVGCKMQVSVSSLRGWAASLSLVALLAGCAAQPDPAMRLAPSGGGARTVELVRLDATNLETFAAPARIATPGGVYLPGPGDVLALHVIDAPELNLPAGYPVAADGTIRVPFLGPVPAADRPLVQTQDDIAQRLREYLSAPQVDLRVLEFNARHVTVVGAVRQPGRYTLTDRPMSVIDAVNAAGGFVDPLRAPGVTILRGGMPIAVDIDGFLSHGQALPFVMDGDVVQLDGARSRMPQSRVAPPAQMVRLYSAGRGRDVPVAQMATLTQAAQAAGAAFGDTVHVLRAEGGRVLALHLTGADAADLAIGGRFALAPGDRVVVTPGAALGQPDHMARLARPLAEF